MKNKSYDPTYVSDTLSRLVNYESTTDNQEEVRNCLVDIAKEIPQSKYHLKWLQYNGVHSLYIRSKGSTNTILLHGHVDVVPANNRQYQGRIRSGRLYGRGALDMKGAVTVMLHLLQNTTGYDLLLTGDEETGGKNGTKYLIETGTLPPYGYVITGEPTGLTVATQEKGVLWLDAIFTGKSAHAAKPWEGENPLEKIATLLHYLKQKYSYPKETWKTTAIPTLIKSTNTQNQVPETIKVGIDCRYIPSDDPKQIIAHIQAWCDKLELLVTEPPLYPIASPYTQSLLALTGKLEAHMHWATDARHFVGTPAVIYGPSGEGMHSANEYVELRSLATMYETLSQLIRNLG